MESNLYGSLKSFYNTRQKKSTVKKMQTAKAENMLRFLKDNFDALSDLRGDKIAEPLKEIQKLAEKVVRENG